MSLGGGGGGVNSKVWAPSIWGPHLKNFFPKKLAREVYVCLQKAMLSKVFFQTLFLHKRGLKIDFQNFFDLSFSQYSFNI